MNRRSFIRQSSTLAAASAVLPFVSGSYLSRRAPLSADLVIYGAGASGTTAAIQAARLGLQVILVENTPWVGGMLTAAGVSALDGNKYGAGGGLVHDFRNALADHYGGIDTLFTGWISLYCYEPHVGERILRSMVDAEPNITLLLQADVVGYQRAGGDAREILVQDQAGTTQPIETTLFLDATEYGDGMAMAGVPYRLGREAQHEYDEAPAPAVADLEMQDLTYAATLVEVDNPPPAPMLSDQERTYMRMFECSTLSDCANPDEALLNHTVHPWDKFITYAALPNRKVLLNWPHHSNDYAVVPAFFEDRFFRKRHLAAAKLHTLQYVRYMQSLLGHNEWQIAEDEYPSEDHLPLIPYIRESRRLVNDSVMRLADVLPVADRPRAPWRADSIAVGDYFIDHHHANHHLPPDQRLVEDYPSNAPFQIAPSVFFPSGEDDRIMVGEKSIAISHIVNGCTRLQPPVMLMGQALGTIAHEALQSSSAPREANIARVQTQLIASGCPLYILYDISPDHPQFATLQRLAQRGILRDDDSLYAALDETIDGATATRWLNRAELSTDRIDGAASTVQRRSLPEALSARLRGRRGPLTREDVLSAIAAHLD